MSQRRYIWVGYQLDEFGVPQPRTHLVQDFSIDPWDKAPPGYVYYWYQGKEYLIDAEEAAQFEAPDRTYE